MIPPSYSPHRTPPRRLRPEERPTIARWLRAGWSPEIISEALGVRQRDIEAMRDKHALATLERLDGVVARFQRNETGTVAVLTAIAAPVLVATALGLAVAIPWAEIEHDALDFAALMASQCQAAGHCPGANDALALAQANGPAGASYSISRNCVKGNYAMSLPLIGIWTIAAKEGC